MPTDSPGAGPSPQLEALEEECRALRQRVAELEAERSWWRDDAGSFEADPHPVPSNQPISPCFPDALLQAHSDLGIGCVVSDDQRLLYANEAFCRLTGYTAQELVDLPAFYDMCLPEDVPLLKERRQVRNQGREVVDHYEVPIRRKDGSLIEAEVSVKLASSGNPPRVIALVRDVSECKKAERLMAEQFKRMQEIDRLKNSFVGAVSHELRTPLATIFGNSELMIDGVAGPLTMLQMEYLRAIHLSSKRLRAIVEDLLDFERLDSQTFRIRPRPDDLRQRLREAVESLKPESDRLGIRLSLIDPDEPLPMVIDPERVLQVLLNLIGNALKFTRSGGSILLLTRGEGEFVRVAIADSGIGIAPEHAAKVFERFYQVDLGDKRQHGGAGLGLSICKGIVESHGGQIGVESEPGNGSTFWFTLPVDLTPYAPDFDE